MKRIKRKTVYESPWLTVHEDKVSFRDKELLYNVVDREDTVVICPVINNEKILLLEHYRYPTEDYGYEFPMGGIENGERPLDAAYRELEQETNLSPNSIEHIGMFYPNPGLSNQKAYVFYASIKADTSEVKITEEEEINGFSILSLKSIVISKQRIRDAFTLSSLQLLEGHLKYLPK